MPGSLPAGSCAPGPLPGATRLPAQALRSFCAQGLLLGKTRLPGQALRGSCAPGPLLGETRLQGQEVDEEENEEDEENKVDEDDEDLCTIGNRRNTVEEREVTLTMWIRAPGGRLRTSLANYRCNLLQLQLLGPSSPKSRVFRLLGRENISCDRPKASC
ncbi:uncharacterized protein [Neodiprion pinetum]|uniref:uncharacterized protein n=1 Tax=Neodiprion pinetum TaxID=441929 RepID=UPI003717AA09